MKKLTLSLFIIISFFWLTQNTSAALFCDQIFEWTFLRYDYWYKFNDTWHNDGNKNVYLNSKDIYFRDNGGLNDLTKSSYTDPGSSFDWTQTLKDAWYTIGAKSSMKIVDTSPTWWRIKKKPSSRSSATQEDHDFMVYYRVGYDFSNNYPDAWDDSYHTECKYYSVSSCGDGVLDPDFEVCDPTDSSKAGWGNGGCNNSCEPVNVAPVATCDGLTATKMSWQASLTTILSCSGTNADSYKIQCGNGKTINSKTWTCTYTSGGNYIPKCIVNNNITSNACEKTISVTNPTPLIAIDKRDANSSDIDGNIGNDTQTVATSTKAVFKMRVTNVGNERLNALEVFDAKAPNCAWSVTLPSSYPSTWSNFKIGGSGNHTNATLEVGEWYEYTCERWNTTSAYTNEATTRGMGVISGTMVSDFDDTKVLIIAPEIQVVKIDANSNDKDTIQWNDTQTVWLWDTAVFLITVKNNGTEDLKDIILTDAQAGACDSNGQVVSLSTKKFTNKLWTVVNLLLSGKGDHDDSIFQIGEVISYTCEKWNTQSDYTNIVGVTWIGVDSDILVDDKDDTKVVVETTNTDDYDLALKKVLSNSTPGPFNKGQDVTFSIIVENQGDVDSGLVEITDYIPEGLTLNDSNWSLSGDKAIRTISNITAGNSISLEISFTINSDAPNSITNLAEISDDSGKDCDSTPDSDISNDWNSTDNAIGNGCDLGWDEDDYDPETIVILNSSNLCTSLVASPATGRNSLTSILTCSGNNVETYKIEVTNSAGDVVETINNSTGQVTLNVIGTYMASCFVDNATTAPVACKKTLSVTTGWGSGSTPQCSDIIQNGSLVTCVWTSSVKSFKLECGTWDTQTVLYQNATKNGVTGRQEAIFNCGETVAQCYVHDKSGTDASDTGAAWRAGVGGVCTTNLNPFCGDGIVQQELWEQCDNTTNTCGQPGATNECKIRGWGGSSGGGSSSGGWPNPEDLNCSDTGSCVLTFPNGGEIVFGPRGSFITGHDVNPLEKNGEKPFLYNNSDYDLSFDALCVTAKDAPDNVINGSEFCLDLTSRNRMIYAYETITLDNYPTFTTNKAWIPTNKDFGDADIITTIKDEWILYNTAYFAWVLDVRVAKPAVVTVGGGTSFIKNTNTTSDINNITTGVDGIDSNDNKNFVGASAGNWAISSFSDEVTDSTAITEIEQENTEYKETVETITNDVSVTGNTTWYGDFENYNGLSNVFVLRWKNVTLSSIPTLSKSTTYIIEWGNLTINDNMESGKNVAFVVKGGNINITSNVKTMDGTYISIPGSTSGGQIASASSPDQLTVNGSLYGNLDNLVANRYYISQDTSGQLSVGTIVSFGSSIFTKPAPLVSQFIGEYLESDKVAR